MFHNFQSERTPVVVLWLHQRPNTSRRSQGRGAKRCVGPLGQSAKLGINRGKTYYPLVIKNSYGKWPIEIDGLPNLKMVIFHSYVSLPEGNKLSSPPNAKEFQKKFNWSIYPCYLLVGFYQIPCQLGLFDVPNRMATFEYDGWRWQCTLLADLALAGCFWWNISLLD